MRGRGKEEKGEWERGWIPEISCWFILDVRGKYEQGVRDCSYTSIHIFPLWKYYIIMWNLHPQENMILFLKTEIIKQCPLCLGIGIFNYLFISIFHQSYFCEALKYDIFFKICIVPSQSKPCRQKSKFITIEIQEATLKNGQPGPNSEPNTG